MVLASLVACSAAPATVTVRKKSTAKKDAGTSVVQPDVDDGEEQDDPPPVGEDGGRLPSGESDGGTGTEAGGGQDGSTAKDGGGPVGIAPTYSKIYADYLGPGSLGHCSGAGCHSGNVGGFTCGNTKESCYTGLVNAGQVSGTTSRIASANSSLTWFGQGGTMPTGGGANSQAAAAISAWVAAGALNN